MLKNKKFHSLSGFGLIELMVSISIVVLVTSIILAKHDSYNGAILLRSQAYDIALKIREVQMQAVSVVGQGADADFRTRLGVCFNTQSAPNLYYIFADYNNNGVCDIGNGEQIGQRGNIDPRFRIGELKLIDGASKTTISDLAILFERPNFDARFFVGGNEQEVDGVEIGLSRVGASGNSGPGDLRVMEVSRTGQILVQSINKPSNNTPCSPGTPNCDNGGSIEQPKDEEF